MTFFENPFRKDAQREAGSRKKKLPTMERRDEFEKRVFVLTAAANFAHLAIIETHANNRSFGDE
ncbi:MAG: hypothetical protein KGL02_11085 [Acidobacteriota bacterium]|nr:hypothetical protein [Acidobacteriota bacterium]MDE3169167.1 hypothetical protein [Acidobacteriota bacterium]